MYRHTLVLLLVTVFSSLYSINFVQARSDDDYKAEIMQHVVDPCFQYSANKSEPIAGISETEMVTLMKMISPQAVEDTINVTLPVVRGKLPEARKEIYKFGLNTCIRGAGK